MDDIDSAFAAYARAHALSIDRDRLEGRGYDRALVEARTRRLMELDWGAPLAVQPDQPRPIFIVGMPRSGSTLVEAMLGAHPQVQANGELLGMQSLLAEIETEDREGRRLDAAAMQTLAASDRAELPSAAGKSHVTDKHPLNFLAVGLILTLFPNAVIVHTRRDPLETGWSIYRQEFSKRWSFTHQLEDIGHFYGEYVRLMDHWERLFRCAGACSLLRSGVGRAVPRFRRRTAADRHFQHGGSPSARQCSPWSRGALCNPSRAVASDSRGRGC
jgi:hypothetical protein